MDFESACRVCLSVNLELFDIFSELESSSYSYRDIIKEIAQLDHNEVDLISKNICVTCRDCCIEFVKFRELITNSNEYQLMALRNEGELKTVVERQVFEDEIVLIDEVEKPLVDESIELSVDINDLGDTDTNDDQLIFSDELTDDAASAGFLTDQSGESDEETVESNVNDSTFSCSKCEQSFKRKSKLEEHVKTHSPKARTNQCKTCKRKFTTEVLLTRHEIIHSDLITQIKSENHQSCIVCNASFKNKPLMEDHMRDHRVKIETEAICCLHCDKPYNKLSNLIRHLKTHDVNKTHLCNVCNKTFAMGQDLIDHLNRHKGFNPHSCHICNKSYMQMSKLKNHLRTHSDDKEFLCTECGKSFNRNSNLRQHLLRHTGVKRFQCGQCPAKFVSKGNLKAHMTTHTSKKPYACSICGSSFTQSYSLVKHNRIHSGERPYQCEFCEMRFYSSDHLKRHIRTHTGEKPYKCEFCTKSFAQNGDLNKHKRLHVGENTYKCTEAGCSEAYRLQSELRDHMKVHYLKLDSKEDNLEHFGELQ